MGTALDGMRVIEAGGGAATGYATKLLADLGADVVKVEPPEGDETRRTGPFPGNEPHPEKSGLFLYLNANKRGVTLNLAAEQGRGLLHGLLRDADLLVHSIPPAAMAGSGVDWDTVHALNPKLVECSISRFGQTGPNRDLKGYELTSSNAGGWATITGAGPEGADLPPLKAFGQQADYQAGLNAAVASLGALLARDLHGEEGQQIDVSIQEAVMTFLEMAIVHNSYGGRVASRLGGRIVQPWAILPAKDGLVFVLTVQNVEWDRFVEWMGNPEWASWEIFDDRLKRAETWDVLRPYIEEWTSQHTVEEIYTGGLQRKLAFAPLSTMQDLLDNEHLRVRGFWATIGHPEAGELTYPGAPWKFSATPWELRSPAPMLGQHNEEVLGVGSREPIHPERWHDSRLPTPDSRRLKGAPMKPLTGIRVCDFSWVWAGPFCTLQLAHLGADVIKIESSKRVDTVRSFVPADDQPGLNRAGYFNQYNQGKRSVALDLSTQEGREIAFKLATLSDVVTENYSAGVMERMGLGYERLKEAKPDIIMISLSGYGGSGPLSPYISYGPAQVPMSGLASLTGYVGGPPNEVGVSYGDPNGGIHGSVAVLAALWHRQRTGEGQYIDQSQWESAIAVLPEGIMAQVMNGAQPERMGNRSLTMAPHGVFRAAGEDEWVSIACGSDAEFAALCQVMGRPELAADPRFATLAARKANEDALEAEVTAWTSGRDRWEVTRALQDAGVAAYPSMTSADLLADPHLRGREIFVELEHPEVGVRTHIGIPWKMSGTPCAVEMPAPLLGQHTDEVLGDVLQMPEAEIAGLRERGVLS